ncbi:hypothetical protein [Sulfuriroseicoccus oceanibius]|uniref:Uncharacterized protein n=1 Tax=Sulfuriroseicoccus oceanibius TaxID=2707525 RepID=A0A6B3L439_9BACT|nr:hypothetical protein [Sulfuriroseicoccus oceanibius]QQL44843.1 hypothetical protein G3M56_013340 [Sulfuriroseicoccus oceanibius]
MNQPTEDQIARVAKYTGVEADTLRRITTEIDNDTAANLAARAKAAGRAAGEQLKAEALEHAAAIAGK